MKKYKYILIENTPENINDELEAYYKIGFQKDGTISTYRKNDQTIMCIPMSKIIYEQELYNGKIIREHFYEEYNETTRTT